MHMRATYFRTAQVMEASRGGTLRSEQERHDAFKATYQWGEGAGVTPVGIEGTGGAQGHRQWAPNLRLAGGSSQPGDSQHLEEEEMDDF